MTTFRQRAVHESADDRAAMYARTLRPEPRRDAHSPWHHTALAAFAVLVALALVLLK